MKSGHYTFRKELDEEESRQHEREAGRVLQILQGKPLSDEPMLVKHSCSTGAFQASKMLGVVSFLYHMLAFHALVC